MINITSPTYSLISPRCECCNQQGSLYFLTCNTCNKIVLLCDERYTVFFDIKKLFDGTVSDLDDPACICPECNVSHVSQFRNSTQVEIQALGYALDEFKASTSPDY